MRAVRTAVRVVLVAALLVLPVATTLLAVRTAPAATVEIAGQPVSVRPVIGRDASSLLGGALVRPQHTTVAGLDVGLDVNTDFNRLAPSDKETRGYLLSLWENPRPALRLIRDAALRHLVGWSLAGFLGGAAVGVAVGVLWWQRRRRLAAYPPAEAALIRDFSRRSRAVVTAVGLVAVLAVDAAGLSVYRDQQHVEVVPSTQLDGTALEGTQVTGLLADLLPFVSVLRPRSSFYDTVAKNLEVALAPISTGPAPAEDARTMVLAEDFEDVNGMAQQVGLAAKVVDADLIALSGDLTFAGKRVETYLLDTIDYYSEKRPVLLAPGLHDTPTIVSAAEVRGWHVADGTTTEIGGLRILAAADPRISTVGNLGTGDVLRDPDTDVDGFVEQTTATACADEPDFVLLHDHRLGARIAASGCVRRAVLDGRSFTFGGPRLVTTPGTPVVEYTSGSAGGHVTTQADPGIIRHPARFSILRYLPSTGVTDYSVVTVSPDARVDVTAWAPFPTAG